MRGDGVPCVPGGAPARGGGPVRQEPDARVQPGAAVGPQHAHRGHAGPGHLARPDQRRDGGIPGRRQCQHPGTHQH